MKSGLAYRNASAITCVVLPLETAPKGGREWSFHIDLEVRNVSVAQRAETRGNLSSTPDGMVEQVRSLQFLVG